MKKCPACESDQQQEEGVYAMLKVTPGGAIQFNVDESTTEVFTANVVVCGNCGFASLYNVP